MKTNEIFRKLSYSFYLLISPYNSNQIIYSDNLKKTYHTIGIYSKHKKIKYKALTKIIIIRIHVSNISKISS